MSLTRALSNAHSGLSSASIRADVTSNNVSNANTPGYVKRTAVAAERTVGGQGNGVRIVSIDRAQDLELTQLRRDADSARSRHAVISSLYATLNQELGQPGDDYGLFNAYEGLETSLRDLSTTPESGAMQNSVIAAARDVINQFNALSSMANRTRSLADNQINRDVSTVNEALHQIKALNGNIGSFNEAAGDPAALEDQRQTLINQIADIIPVKTVYRDGGQLDIITDSGVYLLNGDVQELEFTPVGAVGSHSDYSSGVGSLSGLRVGDQDLTPGSGGHFSITSGSLNAYFAIRDTIVPTFTRQLDALAGDLILRLSQDGLDPTKAPGAPGLFTDAGNDFDPANQTGLAGRLRLNTSVDPVQGGALYRLGNGLGATSQGPTGQSDILNNLLSALTTSTPGPAVTGLNNDHSASSLFAAMSSYTGETTIRQEALSVGATSRANTLADSELQATGVDTDLELQNLLLIEQAYAANARVIQTVGDMLDQLLSL